MRDITDAREMRALAHPIRIALMEALVLEGPLTATQAAKLVEESPSNCSWHLRLLARYGFVQQAGGGIGRNRPWRIVSRGHRWSETGRDSEEPAAAVELTRMLVRRRWQQLENWLDEKQTFPPVWQKAAAIAENLLYLTPEELESLQRGFLELAAPYVDRTYDLTQRLSGTLPVSILFFGVPFRPKAEGE
jgi:DNA-binding transcriptional ArsR family regulator